MDLGKGQADLARDEVEQRDATEARHVRGRPPVSRHG
jgi:hypothetical protein